MDGGLLVVTYALSFRLLRVLKRAIVGMHHDQATLDYSVNRLFNKGDVLFESRQFPLRHHIHLRCTLRRGIS